MPRSLSFYISAYICEVEKIQNIIQKLARLILSKKVAKINRDKSTMNFDKAKTALIIIDGTDSASEKNVLDFIDFLKQNNIRVDCVNYIDKKEFDGKKNPKHIIISKKNLNGLGMPKQKEFADLFEQPYDLLFDFSIKPHFAVQCIVELSMARFKIGMLPGTSTAFDFMIDLGKSKTISEYIKQIKIYLPLMK